MPHEFEKAKLDRYGSAAKEIVRAALELYEHIMDKNLAIKGRFGKNAILKGMNLEKGATAKERNKTIGGHRT